MVLERRERFSEKGTTMPLLSEKPQPSLAAVLAAILLCFAGGIWFLFQSLAMVNLVLNSAQVDGTILTFYHGRFGYSITYSIGVGEQESARELFVFFSTAFHKGDSVKVLYNKGNNTAFIESLVTSNMLFNLFGALATWGIGLIGFKRRVIDRKRNQSRSTLGSDPR